MKRLKEHDLVVLALPREEARLRHGALPFYVVAIFGSVAVLHPASAEETRRLPDEVTGAFLSFRHEGSVVGLQGDLQRRGDYLRFRVSDGVHVPRRGSTRVDAVAPVSVRAADGRTVQGLSVNVGMDGLLAELDEPLRPGEAVEVSLSVPERDEPVRAGGTVVRAEGAQTAVEFSGVEIDTRRFLAILVLERSLAALRRERLDQGGDTDDDFW